MKLETAYKNLDFAIRQCCDHHFGLYACAESCNKEKGRCRVALKFLLQQAGENK